ncbi:MULTISPECIES: anti-sigma-F factor Fin family protein [unclassified Paenibacillus]|uniref:anti-sigma-F factor Fin family protein n=1 Tax=unclassified Paenibacillus TaxID=185978 RepID=UPI001C10776D|nr:MULTISPECIES: anti-sigma-F factor Fin family protein [unclassified Paenibacillus]MBU5444134.1 anti-sigma-F factor Fin family protein [Paenibacillus sp. MSJ-34]CAH0121992.1 Anti-sigma-F factor Fin [Paenibacillus sp. CECT 9249]
MSINYICRHCHTPIGRIDDANVSEAQLGFHFLTPEERSDIISYSPNGDVTVKMTCDYCKEALDNHPELVLAPNPLQ